MQTKDILTLVISAAAFLVALGSAIYIVYWEQKRGILDQFNTVLKDMTSLYIDMTKLYFELKNPQYFDNNVIPLFKQQLGSLLDRAMYLATRILIKGLVTPVAFNILADTNAYLDYLDQARIYYLKSIKASKDNFSKARSTKSYAAFLFRQHDFDAGRVQYRNAIKALKGSNDTANRIRGDIYVDWAVCERYVPQSDPQKSDTLFDSASKEYQEIGIVYMHDQALKYLNERKALHPPSVPIQPSGGILLPPHLQHF